MVPDSLKRTKRPIEASSLIEPAKDIRQRKFHSESTAPWPPVSPCNIVFVDPVPNLQPDKSHPTILIDPQSDPDTLATAGIPVTGIAADGVARIVLLIGGTSVGQQINLSILDENQQAVPAISPGQPSQYGWLSTVNGSETQTTLPVITQQLKSGQYIAFAVYYAPLDFSRGTDSDNLAQSRTVNLQAKAVDGSFAPIRLLKIWRPPVVFVHGLWADSSAWNDFTPLSTDSRFFFKRAAYSWVVPVTAWSPAYLHAPTSWFKPRANSMGFAFSAPVVLSQIKNYIGQFRLFNNAAAAQADVVAHSMGGMVARTLVGLSDNQNNYAGSDSFGQGSIHKLITIGTPHYGSKLAYDLIHSPCVCAEMSAGGDWVFDTVTTNGQQWSGALADLEGDGIGVMALSPAIVNADQIRRKVPTAMIAAQMSPANAQGLDRQFTLASNWHTGFCKGDPVAQNATAALWQLGEFNGQGNDGIVAVTSQLRSTITSSQFVGIVHSAGTVQIGFAGPFELQAVSRPEFFSDIQQAVVSLLNASADTSASGALFQLVP